MTTSINHYSKSALPIKLFVITAATLVFFACKKDMQTATVVDCSGAPKTFATDVNPIIQASCGTGSGCHGSGSSNGPGPLLNYSAVFSAHSDIRSAVASGHMPLNGSLTAPEKNAILCWIDSGAANN